jgi:hypothetical protein
MIEQLQQLNLIANQVNEIGQMSTNSQYIVYEVEWASFSPIVSDNYNLGLLTK